MIQPVTRRSFLQHAAWAGAGLPLALPPLIRAAGANEQVAHASFGVGGKGWPDLNLTAETRYARITALCDVDEKSLAQAKEKFPEARTYTDWRQLLDKEAKNFDSCNVTTPDHMHAPIACSAMRLGKHVYCQKPLTHTLFECRKLVEAAEAARCVTQMGIQLHSSIRVKMGVEIFRSGAIGKVKEVHVWSNRPIWPQGGERPAGEDPVPPHLHWDHWLGVAPQRPYKEKAYHPFAWRGWRDFGTGALGDMGCHNFDPAFWALELQAPRSVKSRQGLPNPESFPAQSIIEYEFAGTAHTTGDTLPLTWYDGSLLPPKDKLRFPEGKQIPDNGAVLVGEKGDLFISVFTGPFLLPQEDFASYAYPKTPADDHYLQFIEAIRGNGKTSTPIPTYSGPLTEMVLLGNVGLHHPGEKLNWNSRELRFDGNEAASQHVRKNYRKGWEIEGLG